MTVYSGPVFDMAVNQFGVIATKDGRHNGVKLSLSILSCMVAAFSAMQRRIGSPSSDDSCGANRCS